MKQKPVYYFKSGNNLAIPIFISSVNRSASLKPQNSLNSIHSQYQQLINKLIIAIKTAVDITLKDH